MAFIGVFHHWELGERVVPKLSGLVPTRTVTVDTGTNDSTFLQELVVSDGYINDDSGGTTCPYVPPYMGGYRGVDSSSATYNVESYIAAYDDGGEPYKYVTNQVQQWGEGDEVTWIRSLNGLYDTGNRYVDGDYYDNVVPATYAAGFSKDGLSCTRTFSMRDDSEQVYHAILFNGDAGSAYFAETLYMWDLGTEASIAGTGNVWNDCVSVSEDGNGSLIIHPKYNIKTEWEGSKNTRPTTVNATARFITSVAADTNIPNFIPLGYAGNYFYILYTSAATASAPRVSAIHITTYAVTEDVLLLTASDFTGSVIPDNPVTPNYGAFCTDMGSNVSQTAITMSDDSVIEFSLHQTTPASSSYTVREPDERVVQAWESSASLTLKFASYAGLESTGELYAYRIYTDVEYQASNSQDIAKIYYYMSVLRLDDYPGEWGPLMMLADREFTTPSPSQSMYADIFMINENPSGNASGYFPHDDAILAYSSNPKAKDDEVQTIRFDGLWETPPSNTFSPVPSGGIEINGTPDMAVSLGVTVSGGVVLSGAAYTNQYPDIYTYSPTGTITLSGTAAATMGQLFTHTPSGSIQTSGAAIATLTYLYSLIPSGSISLFGTATTSYVQQYEATGGIDFSGVADTYVTLQTLTHEPTGEIVLSGEGATLLNKVYNVTGAGGLSTSGSATLQIKLIHAPNGSIYLSGATAASKIVSRLPRNIINYDLFVTMSRADSVSVTRQIVSNIDVTKNIKDDAFITRTVNEDVDITKTLNSGVKL